MTWKPSRLAEGLLVGAFLLAFLIFKAYSIHPTLSDDWIYSYLAKRVGEGAWPYRDFFFAHPPVHLLTLVPVMKVAGFSIAAVRAVPSLSAAVAGCFLWLILRRAGGAIPALVTLVLFLFSYDVLRSSSHVTGANISLAYLACGTWMLFRRWWIAAGILLALASLTALYTLPVVVCILAIAILQHESRWRRTVLSFGAVLLGLQLLVALPAPGAYIDQVYLYHRHKIDNPERTQITWTRAAAHHGLMGAALPMGVSGFLALWGCRRGGAPESKASGKTRGKADGSTEGKARSKPESESSRKVESTRPKRKAKKPSAWRRILTDRDPETTLLQLLGGVFLLCVIQLLFFSRLSEIYTYYLMVPYALLAVAMGLGLAAWGRVLRPWLDAVMKRSRHTARSSRGPASPVPALLLAFVVLVGGCAAVEALRPKAKDIYPAGSKVRYEWRPAPLPGFLNSAVRTLIWRDLRVLGEGVPSVRRYLWHESRGVEHVSELADRVRQITRPEDLLLGDSMLAPLIALLADRRIVEDEADTNTKRFTSGVETVPAFLERLDKPRLEALVFVEGRFLDRYPEFQVWRNAHFEVVDRCSEENTGVLILARRTGQG